MSRTNPRGPGPHGALAILTVGLVALTSLAATTSRAAPVAPLAPGVMPAFLLDPCVAGVLGDVTADGTANVIDAQQIARASAGLAVSGTVAGRLASHGDVTGDGNSNVIDAQQVARASAGLAVAFAIDEPMCGIEVTTSTTGDDIDPDGYDIYLDGLLAASIGVSGTAELTGLAVGSYTVALQDIASNCAVTNGSASRNVDVTEGLTASVAFIVECSGAAVTFGDLKVQNQTQGSNLPVADYTVSLDGGATQNMPVNGHYDYASVASGNHTLVLGNVPGNCTVSGGSTLNFNIPLGTSQTTVNFAINCS
jgi:hypothetical protein